jgi:hypothetical protein
MLTNLYTVMSQNPVDGGDVEIDIGQHKVVQIRRAGTELKLAFRLSEI